MIDFSRFRSPTYFSSVKLLSNTNLIKATDEESNLNMFSLKLCTWQISFLPIYHTRYDRHFRIMHVTLTPSVWHLIWYLYDVSRVTFNDHLISWNRKTSDLRYDRYVLNQYFNWAWWAWLTLVDQHWSSLPDEYPKKTKEDSSWISLK